MVGKDFEVDGKGACETSRRGGANLCTGERRLLNANNCVPKIEGRIKDIPEDIKYVLLARAPTES